MAIGCKICIMTKGLKGSEISSLPQTEEELLEHMESVHHMPVIRKEETEKKATKRFLKNHPEVVDCKKCQEAGAPWTTYNETIDTPPPDAWPIKDPWKKG